jgi:hypothetical protein
MSLGMPLVGPAPTPLPNSGRDGSPSPSTPTGTGQPSGTSSNGGTRVWNDFKGRDPDLVYAGETATVDGKSYTFKAGDTLADAAKALGMDTKALAEKLGMDMSLWGQNGPNGAWFTDGPVPTPGGTKAAAPDVLAPSGTDGTYTKEQVPAIRAEVERLQKESKLPQDTATKVLGLLQKLEKDGQLSASDAAELTGLLKDVKAAQGNGTAPGTDGTGSADSTSFKPDSNEAASIAAKLDANPKFKAAGMLGGDMDAARAKAVIDKIETNQRDGKTFGFTPKELDDLKTALQAIANGTTGALTAEQKTMVNQYLHRAGTQ